MPRRKKVVTPELAETPQETINVDGVPLIEVTENTSKPPSLKDRILGSFEKQPDATPTKRATSKKQQQNEIIAKALPVCFSAFVVSISKQLVKDPYKPLCPHKDEVEAILFPFFSILSRRIKVSIAASQDALDVVAMLTASMTYGTRAMITYEMIERNKNDRNRISVQDTRNDGNTRDEITPSHDTTSASTSDQNDTSGEAEQFSEFFRRDVEGRKQMGLLSRGL